MNFDAVWERIKLHTELKTFIDLAQAVNVLQSAISKRKKGGIFPAEWIFILAKNYNISADFLAWGVQPLMLSPSIGDIGEGPTKRSGEPKPAPGNIDEELLKEAIQAVEEYLAEIKGTLTPEKKAELIMLLCQWHLKEAPESKKINKATVISLVRLAA